MYFFTNRPSLINRCEAIPGISDHEIVFVDSNIAISRPKPVKRKIYMWKKADTQKLKKQDRGNVKQHTEKVQN